MESTKKLEPGYAVVVRNFGLTQAILYITNVSNGVALARNGMMFTDEIFQNNTVLPKDLSRHYSSTEYYAYPPDSHDLKAIKEAVDGANKVAWFEKQKFSLEDKIRIHDLFKGIK